MSIYYIFDFYFTVGDSIADIVNININSFKLINDSIKGTSGIAPNLLYDVTFEDANTVTQTVGKAIWQYSLDSQILDLLGTNTKYLKIAPDIDLTKSLRAVNGIYIGGGTFGSQTTYLKLSEWKVSNPLNSNKITTAPSARNKVAANSLGRGCTIPFIYFDEYAFIPYNYIIYQSAIPAYSTASKNAISNNSP